MGCPYCGMEYSFYFRHQFHKKGCPGDKERMEEEDE